MCHTPLTFRPNLAPCDVPRLSPPTLTESETRAILAATSSNVRDHVIYSLALGTGHRLSEIVWLNVGGVVAPDGAPRSRERIPEIAKDGRADDVFLLAGWRVAKLVSGPVVFWDSIVLRHE